MSVTKQPTHLSDDSFTKLLPEYLQKVSKTHFTPVHIARMATEWLTENGPKNILDIGAGVGKFCIAGAMHSDSFFCGIEHRPSLVEIANDLIRVFDIQNAVVQYEDIIDVDFLRFDAFYLFNPFYENMVINKRLNNEVSLSDARYKNYMTYTATQLDITPKGTRVVTYHGDNAEVPPSFITVMTSKDGLLKLWVKR